MNKCTVENKKVFSICWIETNLGYEIALSEIIVCIHQGPLWNKL